MSDITPKLQKVPTLEEKAFSDSRRKTAARFNRRNDVSRQASL